LERTFYSPAHKRAAAQVSKEPNEKGWTVDGIPSCKLDENAHREALLTNNTQNLIPCLGCACSRPQLKQWMEQAGMESWVDAIGNVHGHINGSDPAAPAIIIGSHYDTVLDGGK